MPESRSPAFPVPRWVRVSAIAAVAALALVIAAMFAGHGPRRHMQAMPVTSDAGLAPQPAK